jgi:hypothetical protein
VAVSGDMEVDVTGHLMQFQMSVVYSVKSYEGSSWNIFQTAPICNE